MKHSHQYTDELRLKDNQNLSWNKLLYLSCISENVKQLENIFTQMRINAKIPCFLPFAAGRFCLFSRLAGRFRFYAALQGAAGRKERNLKK